MIRKFKITSVFLTIVAISAVTASAAQATFTSAGYPTTITGTATGNVTDMFGSTMKCTESEYTGTLTGPSKTYTVTPKEKKCSGFGLPATFDFTSCDYVFHNIGPITYKKSIECTKKGDKIDTYIYPNSKHEDGKAICHVEIPEQTELGTVTLTNNANGTFTLSGSIGFTATQTRTSLLCPLGTHTSTATETIQAGGIVFSGNNGAVSVD